MKVVKEAKNMSITVNDLQNLVDELGIGERQQVGTLLDALDEVEDLDDEFSEDNEE